MNQRQVILAVVGLVSGARWAWHQRSHRPLPRLTPIRM